MVKRKIPKFELGIKPSLSNFTKFGPMSSFSLRLDTKWRSPLSKKYYNQIESASQETQKLHDAWVN
jgi:hypothetical protein